MHTRLPVFVLFLSSIGWGITWWPIKELSALGLDNLWLVFIAYVAGTIVLFPWFYWQRAAWKKRAGFMLWIAVAGGTANVTFQLAMAYGDVIRVMILFYLLPVWSVIGGRMFLGEKIDAMRVMAVVMCLAGAMVILDIVNVDNTQGITWIDVLAIVSGMSFAMTNILFRSVQDVPVMSKLAFMFLGSGVLIGGSLLFFATTISDASMLSVYLAMLYGAVWLILITLGSLWAVTRMEAGRSAIIIVMELVAAVISTALLTENILQLHEITGALLVLSAAVMEGLRVEASV